MHDIKQDLVRLEAAMEQHSHDLEFEQAIRCRDTIKRLTEELESRNGSTGSGGNTKKWGKRRKRRV